MASDGFLSGPGLQNAVLNLAQSAESQALRVLHAVGLASDANGQPAWPFTSRIATETLAIDAGLARQVALTLACVVIALLLAVWATARRRGRRVAWITALGLLLVAPWPARSLILTDAQASSFHHSPSSFSARSIARGLTLYQSRCASCHGADGKGEGALAASLPMWPPRLGGELLWHRAEGDLFGTVVAGRRDRHGTRTMPGFAGTLGDDDVWALIDAMKALAAGSSIRGEGAWVEPVRAPDALVHCGGGVPDRMLSALRGERVRIVADGGGAPKEDPRFETIVLQAPGAQPSDSARQGCVLRGPDAWTAYAEVSGASVDRFAGTQLLVDRDGWLRAYGAPGKTAWSRSDLVCRSSSASRAVASTRDGLGDLVAAIDADPVRSNALGIAHAP